VAKERAFESKSGRMLNVKSGEGSRENDPDEVMFSQGRTCELGEDTVMFKKISCCSRIHHWSAKRLDEGQRAVIRRPFKSELRVADKEGPVGVFQGLGRLSGEAVRKRKRRGR